MSMGVGWRARGEDPNSPIILKRKKKLYCIRQYPIL